MVGIAWSNRGNHNLAWRKVELKRKIKLSDKSKEVAKKSGPYSDHEYDAGLRVVHADAVADPGIEPHRVRMTDKSEAHEKRAARQVAALFLFSIVSSAFALYAYFAFPIVEGSNASVRDNTLLLGLGAAFGMLAIGIGAVHWAKTLMPDAEGGVGAADVGLAGAARAAAGVEAQADFMTRKGFADPLQLQEGAGIHVHALTKKRGEIVRELLGGEGEAVGWDAGEHRAADFPARASIEMEALVREDLED